MRTNLRGNAVFLARHEYGVLVAVVHRSVATGDAQDGFAVRPFFVQPLGSFAAFDATGAPVHYAAHAIRFEVVAKKVLANGNLAGMSIRNSRNKRQ